MIKINRNIQVGGSQQGISAGDQLVGSGVVPDTLFLQNDTATAANSPWYVTRVDSTHYTMLNATAPKTGQYLGAFIWDGKTDSRGARAGAGVVWESSNSDVVKINSVTTSGQAIVSILKAGSATLKATLNGMVSTMQITAV